MLKAIGIITEFYLAKILQHFFNYPSKNTQEKILRITQEKISELILVGRLINRVTLNKTMFPIISVETYRNYWISIATYIRKHV